MLFNIRIHVLSFQTLEFRPYPFEHWNSGLILSSTGYPALSFLTLEFWPYPFKHWNSGPILSNTGILALCF